MKTSLAVAVGAALLVSAYAGAPMAQDAKAPSSRPDAMAPQAGASMNMGGHMAQMDDHMKKMQALHEKVTSARTPEDRQKAMQEQRAEMQAGMGMMNQMNSGGGKMGGMGGGMMGQKGKPADADAQMQLMQKRMDMMEMMMQTMMDQQGMMGGPKSPGAATGK